MDKTGQLAVSTLILLLILSACNVPMAKPDSPQSPTVEATVPPPATESPTAPVAPRPFQQMVFLETEQATESDFAERALLKGGYLAAMTVRCRR